jgi:hypothetical protein
MPLHIADRSQKRLDVPGARQHSMTTYVTQNLPHTNAEPQYMADLRHSAFCSPAESCFGRKGMLAQRQGAHADGSS